MHDPEQDTHDESHLPSPTFYPIGFAIGIAVVLVGLIVNPRYVSTIGGAIAIVFGFLWAREASSGLREESAAVEPERRDRGAAATDGEGPMPSSAQRFPRNRFLEASTLGLGALIGGIVSIPVAGFVLLPPFVGQKKHRVDLGPISEFAEGEWYITTFTVDPQQHEVARRTAFIRNNGNTEVEGQQVPSFTIISNRCVHLGCPVQANGPSGAILGEKNKVQHTVNGIVTMTPSVPAGFGCPCHGGQYDTEGNRTAGPPVRALDRYAFEINHGRLVLVSAYSVSKVEGTGAQAKIHKYKRVGPGEHIDGVEQALYPLNPPQP